MSILEQESFISSIHPFGSLTINQLALFVENIDIVYFKENVIVQKQNSEPTHLYFVLKGLIQEKQEDEVLSLYSKNEKIPNDISVHTKELSNLDLYHFGWNIWNYFRPIKQEEISKLLKTVFVSLDDIDLDSIKSHLKDEPQKGNIKIQEDLTDYQKT